MKSVLLALQESTKKWTKPIRNWGIILNQFLIIFEERVNYKKTEPSNFYTYTLYGIVSTLT